MHTHTHTHNRFTALLDFVRDYPGEPVLESKTNLDLIGQNIVSGSGICWAICNAYSLWPSARSPPVGDTWVHLIPHSTHPQSSSLHGIAKAGSCSEIEKRALKIHSNLLRGCIRHIISHVHFLSSTAPSPSPLQLPTPQIWPWRLSRPMCPL